MITKFKIFESNEDEPKVGDYVKVRANYFELVLREYFKNSIGKIISISNRSQRRIRNNYTIRKI